MEVTNLLQKLIAIKSFSGHENELAKFITTWLSKYGLKTQRVGGNLALKIKGRNSPKAIIFDGHMDTVMPGNLKNWKTDPFKAAVIGKKLYGLGASDMKGGVAVMMTLAKELVKNPPPIDVWLAFVVKEEFDGSGSKEFVDWFTKNQKYKKVAAVIGDTTGLENIEIGHKGNIFIKVRFFGQSGHGSRPDLIAKQAILDANQFIVNSLDDKLNEWQKKYPDDYLSSPSIAVTGISSGDSSPNKVPGECMVQLDIRTTPRLHQNLKNELDGWLDSYEVIATPAPYGYCSPKERIVQIAAKIAPKAEITCSSGATDQCFFTAAGIPAIIFGPGNKAVMHQENEWVDIEELNKFVEVYKRIVDEFGKIME